MVFSIGSPLARRGPLFRGGFFLEKKGVGCEASCPPALPGSPSLG